MSSGYQADPIDAKVLRALAAEPRATVLSLSEQTGLSRNTVHSRLTKLEASGALRSVERRVDPAALGYPMTAFILTDVVQRELAAVAEALAAIPEILEVHGLSGATDLLVHVVARDADDLYRIAGQVLDIDGVERTTTSLVMRRLMEYRLDPLLRRFDDAGNSRTDSIRHRDQDNDTDDR